MMRIDLDVNNPLVIALADECDNIRRREASDIEDIDGDEKGIPYIDTNDFVKSVSSSNNTIIWGKRGSGKTSLLLKVNENNKYNQNQNLLIIKDMQSLKAEDSDYIVTKLLGKLFMEMAKCIDNEVIPQKKKEYQEKYRGISGIIKKLFSKDKCDKKDIAELAGLSEIIRERVNYFERLSCLDEEIIGENTSSNHVTVVTNKYSKSEIKSGMNISPSFEFLNKLGTTKAAIDASYNINITSTSTAEESLDSLATISIQTRRDRKYFLKHVKETNAEIVKAFYLVVKKRILFMLDDFYQVQYDNQPYIVQYLHDLSKDIPNKAFRIKIFTIPGRLKLNENGANDMSYKDDFSPITIDTDISDIENLQTHLADVLSAISKNLNEGDYLSREDIFVLLGGRDSDVFMNMIYASGGIHRDFLVMFKDVIKTARNNGRRKISKKDIYEVVKQLRHDKDSSVKSDASLSEEMIDILQRKLCTEVADRLKTNVFLYPADKAGDSVHSVILENLKNLRYIYSITEVTSEKTKNRCQAFLIDMSFWIVKSRLKPGFTVRKYWEKSEKSSVLRQSEEWYFDNDIVEMVRKDITNNTSKKKDSEIA